MFLDAPGAHVFFCARIRFRIPGETGMQIILILSCETGVQIKSAYFFRPLGCLEIRDDIDVTAAPVFVCACIRFRILVNINVNIIVNVNVL